MIQPFLRLVYAFKEKEFNLIYLTISLTGPGSLPTL